MKLPKTLICIGLGLILSGTCLAALQDKYELPDNYLALEKQYLKEFPKLQDVMDVMIVETEKQLPKPQNDILHNRVCTALVYDMAKDAKLSDQDTYLAVAGDLLHNIAKGDKKQVLTDADYLAELDAVVLKLKNAGYLKNSPEFWTETSFYSNPKIGNNLGEIHHLSGAVMAGKLLKQLGFPEDQILQLQAAIIEHSTGYWYFRTSVSDKIGDKEGWKKVYPAPENQLADFVHDADLISQFEYASVVPEGSKWRLLATNRWGAKDTPEDQAYVVYYVFQKLFEEARTPKGKELAKAEWDKIAPELKKLMGMKDSDDPIAIKGTPDFFKEK